MQFASKRITICREMVVVCDLCVPAHSNYRGGTPGLIICHRCYGIVGVTGNSIDVRPNYVT